jgi:hypothetical protein
LAAALSAANKFQTRTNEIHVALATIDRGVDDLRASSSVPGSEAQVGAAIKDFFKKSNDTFSDANLLGQDTLDEAHKLKER